MSNTTALCLPYKFAGLRDGSESYRDYLRDIIYIVIKDHGNTAANEQCMKWMFERNLTGHALAWWEQKDDKFKEGSFNDISLRFKEAFKVDPRVAEEIRRTRDSLVVQEGQAPRRVEESLLDSGPPGYAPSRVTQVMRLSPGRAVEYVKRHAAVRPGVLERLSASHIHDYSISLESKEGLLIRNFEYSGEDYDRDMRALVEGEETKRWWNSTGGSWEDPHSSWTDMQVVFHRP